MLRKARGLAVIAAAALGVLCSPVQAATITINVGASTSFANTLVDMIGTFQAFYFASGVSYNIAVTVDTNANLEASVLDGTFPYDLILTDDPSMLADLTANYSGYVQGLPFVFAHDRLDLYSITTDVSKVLTGIPRRFTGPLVIADPTSDAYGVQSANLLSEEPWDIETIPSARVVVQPDVATVQAGVDVGLYPYGIVAKSAICTNPNGAEVYPDGSYHHEFWPLLGERYHRIDLTGLLTAVSTRTTDQATELTDFINFLTGVGTTQGTDVLTRSCYALR